MKNKEFKANTLFSTSNLTFEPQVPFMISEGRLENLEEIADQIEKLEKREKKWDPMQTFGSSSFAIFLTLLVIWWSETNLTHSFLIAVIMISCGVVGILFFFLRYAFYKENKLANSDEVAKLKRILSKVRSSRKNAETQTNSRVNESH